MLGKAASLKRLTVHARENGAIYVQRPGGHCHPDLIAIVAKS